MAATNFTHSDSVEIAAYEDPLHVSERVAIAAFLAGYSGGTRSSYTTDLRVFAGWCHEHRLNLFSVKRAHLELFGRWMEQEGRMASTIARRLRLRRQQVPSSLESVIAGYRLRDSQSRTAIIRCVCHGPSTYRVSVVCVSRYWR